MSGVDRPVEVSDDMLTGEVLDAIAGGWPVLPGGEPDAAPLRRVGPAIPPSQQMRLAVFAAAIAAAADGLPVPDISFCEHSGGRTSLNLRLLDGDRAGVDAWAVRIGLPPAALSASGVGYQAQRHGSGDEDVWLGSPWVNVWCHIKIEEGTQR